MARITTFEAGYCTHIACMALKGAGWKVCKFPARSWLLSVGDQHWLWDTGYAEWFERATRQGVFHLYRRITPVHFDPREAMVAQLAAIGQEFRLGGAVGVLDPDHCVGDRDRHFYRKEGADEVQDRRKGHRCLRGQRLGGDRGGHGICGVMEPVCEIEGQRRYNHKRQE